MTGAATRGLLVLLAAFLLLAIVATIGVYPYILPRLARLLPALPSLSVDRTFGTAGGYQMAPSNRPEPASSAPGPTYILLRAEDLTPEARLNIMGYGFLPGEEVTVTIEDSGGRTEARLGPVMAQDDGNISEVSLPLPGGLPAGDHVVRLEGTSSHRSARAAFRLRRLLPQVELDSYSVKPEQPFGFSGTGFAPQEEVEVRIGGLGGEPLATFRADGSGNVDGHSLKVPLVQPGDYPLYFVGSQSQNPVAVKLNVQGFQPWVVLDNYAPPQYYRMGFKGEDFAPGEEVLVYLGEPAGEPAARVVADASGRFEVKEAVDLPTLQGDGTLVFVGQRTRAVITATFKALPFSPSLELTAYAGRPGSPVAFIGSGWARDETLRAYAGDGQEVATFRSDPGGSFHGAGTFRIPVRTAPGPLALTVVGEASQAQATVYYQVLELQPSAELTAYDGPPGTVVSFSGRGFAGGERVQVHLGDHGGPVVARAKTDDEGSFEMAGACPVDGDWGDIVPFTMVGEDSGAEATTHFTFQ